MGLSEAEEQVLIALAELAQRGETADRASLERLGSEYFRKRLVDWSGAFASLATRGLLAERDGVCALTPPGEPLAGELRRARPQMWYWYCDYYAATKESQAHHAFCERAYGKDLCQHGFADMDQLGALLDVLKLREGDAVLDLGCGNGLIAEHVSDVTGAHVHGIDYVPEAIRQAQERTAAKRHRLTFQVGSIDRLDFPAGTFDAIISIDTLYFTDVDDTVRPMRRILKPGGRIAAYYSIALRDYPGSPPEVLLPDRTPLAEALARQGLRYQTWDYTEADYRHARLRRLVLEELAAEFEAEGNAFLYENRMAEAKGCAQAIEEGTHRRYLYHAA